jgi:diguanylate cyclase
VPENPLLFAVGVAIGLTILMIGFFIGRRQAKRTILASVGGSVDGGDGLSPNERERMVQLLQELGNWTSEYSGNVSQYQDQLGEISRSVRSGLGGAGSENRVVLLLEQIMQSNSQLQKRLDAAERQLEKQTRQIESYLSEARTDGLTGLFNRRAFDQKLDELFAAYRKGGRTFSVAIIDIDHFKKINDTHGHQAGDQVLQQVAAKLHSELAQAIMVARFGGEEFAILLDEPLRFAAEKMNSVRKAIAAHKLDAGSAQIAVTTSVGVGEPREDMVPGPVVRRADEALYAAKNMGRNRTYFHDGRSPILVGAPELTRD